MFTGIVEELGTVTAIEGDDDGLQLQIDAPALASLSAIGDS
ncbi:MAG: Lumazine binding domain, partial [Gaiellales bacterium]|nr:Lumazine binding domain [Gaiellales bacterium]